MIRTQEQARQRRLQALTFLVFLVAGVTLVESWFACVAAAEAGGRPLPWLWPTTLEAFAIALILVAWDSLSDGRPARLVRLLLFVTTLVMAAVQVLDAPATALGWLTAAWTPVGLNLSVEVAVRLRYDAQRRADEAHRVAATVADRVAVEAPERDAGASQNETARETLTPVAAVSVASQIPAGKRRMIEARQRRGMGGKAIASETGVSQRLVYAYLQELPQPDDASVAGNGGGPSHE